MSDSRNIKDSKQIRCALVTVNPFPIGNVATMRYSSYMKALAGNISLSKVYVFAPSRTARPNRFLAGVQDCVHYEYTAGKIWLANRNIFTMAYYLARGLVKCWKSIKADKIDTLILYGENPWLINAFFKLLCICRKISFFGDRSEYPDTRIRKPGIPQWLYRMKIGWFDGMILMTSELESFYSKWLKKGGRTFLLPMTIDCSRFDNVERAIGQKYIAVVFGTHNRDGLLESLKAYKIYRQSGGTYDLYLVGNYQGMPNKAELDELVLDESLPGKIRICGLLQNDKVPQILANASCLMTTPNFYVSGGFPTKVGEYMLSGVPVVATNAGDLLKYIEPEKEMLFSEPGDLQDIARNLLRIETDPELGSDIAARARKKVLTVFNAEAYAKDLCGFLSSAHN